MALPYIPYDAPNFRDLMGVIQGGLDAKLAREKMQIDLAQQERLAAERERNAQRQHEQQMAQFGLSQLKANYEISQSQPGGLEYAKSMAQIR